MIIPVLISADVVCFSTSAWYSSREGGAVEAVLELARDGVETRGH